MYRALCGFSGKVSMAKGQVAEIKDEEVIKDLLCAGYIEKVEETPVEETGVEPTVVEEKPKNKKSKKK